MIFNFTSFYFGVCSNHKKYKNLNFKTIHTNYYIRIIIFGHNFIFYSAITKNCHYQRKIIIWNFILIQNLYFNFCRLKVELFVHTERFLKEEFKITCCKEGAPMTIYLNARIFGKDQGTPILRNGIRCVAVEKIADIDDDEDQDDDEDTEKIQPSDVARSARELRTRCSIEDAQFLYT